MTATRHDRRRSGVLWPGARHGQPAPDPALPNLVEVFDLHAMSERLYELVPEADHVELESFRHKPGLSAVFSWRMTGETVDVSLHGRLSTPANHGEVRDKLRERQGGEELEAYPHASYDALGLVVTAFPHDRSIRGLPHLMEPDRLKRILHRSTERFSVGGREVSGQDLRLEVVSCKPERHCVVRCELAIREPDRPGTTKETIYARAHASDAGLEVHRVASSLQVSDAFGGTGAPIARALGHDAERRISFNEALPGETLLGAPRSGRFLDLCEWTGWFCARLHGASVRPARKVRLERLVEECASTAETLLGAGVQEASVLLERLRELRSSPPPERGRSCIHGDLHPGQILAATSAFACLDLDAACAGDPALDLGYFLAHLRHLQVLGILDEEWREAATQRFFEGLAHGGGRRPSLEVLNWHHDLSLVRLALNAAKIAHSGWQSKFEDYLRGRLT